MGDTIMVVEHDIPEINDSIVIRVEIPEEYEKSDSIDWANWHQLDQLSGTSAYFLNSAGKDNLGGSGDGSPTHFLIDSLDDSIAHAC